MNNSAQQCFRLECKKLLQEMQKLNEEFMFSMLELCEYGTTPSQQLQCSPNLGKEYHYKFYKYLIEKRGAEITKEAALNATDLDGFLYLYGFGVNNADDVFKYKQYKHSQICAYLLNNNLVDISMLSQNISVLELYLQAGVGCILNRYPHLIENSAFALLYTRRHDILKSLLYVTTTDKNVILLILDFVGYELTNKIDYDVIDSQLRILSRNKPCKTYIYDPDEY
jgi:hypothetical protein